MGGPVVTRFLGHISSYRDRATAEAKALDLAGRVRPRRVVVLEDNRNRPPAYRLHILGSSAHAPERVIGMNVILDATATLDAQLQLVTREGSR